jgi:hypothetical protein
LAKQYLNPVSINYKAHLSEDVIEALKEQVESTFHGVGFLYDGVEYDYNVHVVGPRNAFERAINFLFDKTKPGIEIQLSEIKP